MNVLCSLCNLPIVDHPCPTGAVERMGSQAVNYSTPAPETAAFMLRIDDSEIDLGQVETALSDMEHERDAARINYEQLNAQMQKICGLILDPWTAPYSFKAHLRRHAALLDAAEQARGIDEPENH